MDPTAMPPSPAQTGLSLKAKILILLAAVLAIVLATLVAADRQKNEEVAMGAKEEIEQRAGQKEANMAEEPLPVEKTSNVDAVVNGIIDDYAADADIAAEGDADVDYLNDSAALINPEGDYNESEF